MKFPSVLSLSLSVAAVSLRLVASELNRCADQAFESTERKPLFELLMLS